MVDETNLNSACVVPAAAAVVKLGKNSDLSTAGEGNPIMAYKLYAVRIFSFKWQESLEFYQNVVGFPVSYKDNDMGWAQFDLGGAFIGLERCDQSDPEAAELVGRFVGTSIEVPDIQSAYESLKSKGTPFVSPPEQQPWGSILAHFKDPDDNILTLLGGVAD